MFGFIGSSLLDRAIAKLLGRIAHAYDGQQQLPS
jgi:hypothetical protein